MKEFLRHDPARRKCFITTIVVRLSYCLIKPLLSTRGLRKGRAVVDAVTGTAANTEWQVNLHQQECNDARVFMAR